MEQTRSSAGRVHLVLVPGFAGFDALGQIEYYAGVTGQYQACERARPDGLRMVLHYFDNFPTASITTRAARLHAYLAKRVARGEFWPSDEVVLIGHSTGGLDIRRLLWDLMDREGERLEVDGSEESAAEVAGSDILGLVTRVVFMSVPQWGTNIADFVRSQVVARHAVLCGLQELFAGSQLPLVRDVENLLLQRGASLAHEDIVRAIGDALREAEPTGDDLARIAYAQEAASKLQLWLRHMASDFRVIEDLTAQPTCTEFDPPSPAHFSIERRTVETLRWANCEISTRSYATLGRRPSPLPKGAMQDAPTESAVTGAVNEGPEHVDWLYRECYRACTRGPLDTHDPAAPPRCLTLSQQERVQRWLDDGLIQPWDNDGIVNTVSMLWPDGPNTILVPADHMDIVGHYKTTLAPPRKPRTYHSYDLLGSASQFTDQTFRDVWSDIFSWALTGA